MRRHNDRSAEFRSDSLLYRFVFFLIVHLFPPVFRLLYGYRVVGSVPEEDLKAGAVTVCNHVHTLDCIMLGCAFCKYRMQFLTLSSNLRMPVAGPIVALMGGIGLPEDLMGWKDISGRVEKAFAAGQLLQIYPEGELVSGCRTLREFMPGAFHFAVKYNKPVIPCVLRFYDRYDRRGKRRGDGRELVILPPVYPAEGLKGKAAALWLEEQARSRMEEALR